MYTVEEDDESEVVLRGTLTRRGGELCWMLNGCNLTVKDRSTAVRAFISGNSPDLLGLAGRSE